MYVYFNFSYFKISLHSCHNFGLGLLFCIGITKGQYIGSSAEEDDDEGVETTTTPISFHYLVLGRVFTVRVNSIQIWGKPGKPKSDSTKNSLKIDKAKPYHEKFLTRPITTTTIVRKMMLGYGILHLLKIEFVCTTRRQCIGEWLLLSPLCFWWSIFIKMKKKM